MAGSVDLSNPTSALPPLIVVDTNLVFELLAASFGYSQHPAHGPRAQDFSRRLRHTGTFGVVMPATFIELTHLLVKFAYQHAFRHGKSALVQRFGPLSSWADLYKRDPSILQGMQSDLSELTRLMAASQLYLFDPDRFLPIASGRTHAEELIHVMCEYGLDSGDAQFLIEAQRAPVLEIATLDADLLRAERDFTIYTWL